LQKRIALRGRDIESKITAEYLAQLNELYEEWIQGFSLSPVLIVPSDDVDFVNYPGHLDLVIKKVEEKLRGKEEVVFAPEDIQNFR
jgi:deoxyadenosine/deoxycytidine kinase